MSEFIIRSKNVFSLSNLYHVIKMADTLKKACLDIKFIRESTYEPCAINKQRQMSVVIFFNVDSEVILVHVYRKKEYNVSFLFK